jgi:hypothetical protein
MAEDIDSGTAGPRTEQRGVFWSEAWVGIVLFVAGASVAMVYTSTVAQQYGGYLDRFGAAFSIANGVGFNEVKTESFPEAKSFLEQDATDVFQPKAPPEIVETVESGNFQNAHSYLMYAVGYVWRIFGISWSSLVVLPGVFCGLTTVGAYAFLRLVCSRPLAIAGAILFLAAPFHVSHTNALRDYSKAPFLLWAFFLCGYLVLRAPTRRNVLLSSALLGLVLGIGRGFRFDVVLGIPFYLATLVVFLQGGVLRNIWIKLQGLVAFVIVFFVVGFGIRAATTGGVTFHVIFLGLMTPFDPLIGIERSIYDCGYMFGSDASAWAIVGDYKQRVAQSPGALQYVSQDNERFAAQYLYEIARTFPADMLTRIYAAIHTALTEVPFGVSYPNWGVDIELPPDGDPTGLRDLEGHLIDERMNAPLYVTNEFLLKLYTLRSAILGPLKFVGVLLAAVPILAVCVWNFRVALFALFFVFYWCGSLVMQFDIRHAFHMQIVGLFAMCIIIQTLYRILFDVEFRRAIVTGLDSKRKLIFALAKPLLFATAIILALWGPLEILRSIQRTGLINLFALYEQAPVETKFVYGDDLGKSIEQADRMRIDLRQTYPDGEETKGLVYSDYYVLEIGRHASHGSPIVEFRTVFESNNMDFNDHGRTYQIQLPLQGTTKVFVPVYNFEASMFMGHSSRFLGIDISTDDVHCVRKVDRIADLSKIPLLLGLVLSPDWQDRQLYQRIMTDASHRRNWVLNVGGRDLNAVDDKLLPAVDSAN